MRFVPGLALLAATFAAGGCQGQSEEQIRGELRAQMLQRCNRDIAPSTSALPGFDSAGYCNCVTDKAMGERSLAELKTLFEDRARTAAEGRAAATECLAGQSEAVRQAVVVAPEPEPEPEAPRAAPKAEPRPAPPPVRREPAVERPAPTPSVRVAPEPARAPIDEDVEEEPSDRL
jgi:hypothetical protein